MFKQQIDINEVSDFVAQCGPSTKIYIGCDSERLQVNNVWYADYITAVVIHVNSKHGCKLFGAVERERLYENRADRLRMRLMGEVYRVSKLYLELADVIENDIEVHLDISEDRKHGSSCIINEAVGYVRGMCNVIPMVKPNAWAATNAADRFKTLKSSDDVLRRFV